FKQLLPWISCGYSPLVLKESLFLTILAITLFCFSWTKIRSQWLGQEVSAFGDENRGITSWAVKPEFWGFLFMLYAAVTVAWSPVFQQSLHTWVLLAGGITVVALCRSNIVSRS